MGLTNPKLHFYGISGSSKFIVNINVQINVTRSIFIINRFLFFWNARNNILYQNQYQNYQKTANYRRTIPLRGPCRQKKYFFIWRFYAIMHRTTVVQNKIITIICLVFFCSANIYRPSLGKVQFGVPNPKQIQSFNFYLRGK